MTTTMPIPTPTTPMPTHLHTPTSTPMEGTPMVHITTYTSSSTPNSHTPTNNEEHTMHTTMSLYPRTHAPMRARTMSLNTLCTMEGNPMPMSMPTPHITHTHPLYMEDPPTMPMPMPMYTHTNPTHMEAQPMSTTTYTLLLNEVPFGTYHSLREVAEVKALVMEHPDMPPFKWAVLTDTVVHPLTYKVGDMADFSMFDIVAEAEKELSYTPTLVQEGIGRLIRRFRRSLRSNTPMVEGAPLKKDRIQGLNAADAKAQAAAHYTFLTTIRTFGAEEGPSLEEYPELEVKPSLSTPAWAALIKVIGWAGSGSKKITPAQRKRAAKKAHREGERKVTTSPKVPESKILARGPRLAGCVMRKVSRFARKSAVLRQFGLVRRIGFLLAGLPLPGNVVVPVPEPKASNKNHNRGMGSDSQKNRRPKRFYSVLIGKDKDIRCGPAASHKACGWTYLNNNNNMEVK